MGTMHRRALILLSAAIPAIAGGCRAPSNADMLSFLRESQHHTSAMEYRVGIPDGIAISAPQILEIHGEAQRIQPDGKVTLDLVGEVKIVGMTAKEIAAKLETLLSRYYVDPKVNVRVTAYASKKYYVTGETVSTGPREYTGRDTLMDAVLRANPSFLTWTSRVQVVRPSRDGETPKTILVDVNRMIRRGDWSKNILLEPDDVVHIPATPVAWVGLRIRELLFPVAPVLEAYQAPASVIAANDVYDDRNDNDGYSSNRRAVQGRRGVVLRR
jgi:protein involved in polysaccharide export with SLBB domain